jgi:hypothetical protein
MVHEEERFILEALSRLSSGKLMSMDIRFLILDRNSNQWMQRAILVLQNRPKLKGVAFDRYKKLSEDAEEEIRHRIPNVEIAFYDGFPTWRLYIFADRLFVSRYSGPGDPFSEGHLVPAAAFYSDHPMYEWLFNEFRLHYPGAWRDPPES